jgi:radical SAM protein with 4Fe4S-binding SPASM domain
VSRIFLQSVILEVTRSCNHACLHCYNFWSAPGYAGQAGLDVAAEGHCAPLEPLLERLLEQVTCRTLVLTGGEPLLRPDLPQLVEFIARRGPKVNLITNGHLLSEALTARLIEAGVTIFELPLLSFRREVHDALSGASGAFDAVLAALAHIRKHRGQAVAVFVATKRNIADLGETLKLAYAFGARGVMFNRFNPGGRGLAHLEELLPTLGQVREALGVAERAATALGLPISCSIPLQPCLIDMSEYPHLWHGFCAAGSQRAYYTIDPSGDVRPCNHTPTVLGNLWQAPFAAIISPERLFPFVSALPAFCASCRHRATCQGGCKAAAQVCYGDLSAEEPFLRTNLASARPARA